MFDWITPLYILIQRLMYRREVGFIVPMATGITPDQIKHLLESNGIWMISFGVYNGDLFFIVRRPQADYAQYWLERLGLSFRQR